MKRGGPAGRASAGRMGYLRGERVNTRTARQRQASSRLLTIGAEVGFGARPFSDAEGGWGSL
jgi:hypothetical protein